MREQPEKLGMTLINRNRPNYKTTSKLKHNIMIQIPMKPEKPEHIDEAIISDLREYWIKYIYNCYDKYTIQQHLVVHFQGKWCQTIKWHYQVDCYSKLRSQILLILIN